MSEPPKLRVAFLTALDPKDRRSYSGCYYYMAQALVRNTAFDVTFITLINPVEKSIRSTAHKIAESSSLKKKLRFLFTFYNAFRYARTAKQKMKGYEFDFIIAPAAAREIAFLKTKTPIIYVNDTTWGLLLNYYPNHSNLAGIAVFQGQVIEKRAIRKSALLFYSSQWAADSAIKDYGANASHVSVIKWGANMDDFPARDIVLKRKLSKECRLLFVGRAWQRKGGIIAFETLLELEKIGINAHLTVCGCKPPDGITHTRLTVIQNLNKDDEQQYKQLKELFLNSDFFILPTRAECSCMSFCEASAFGLPAIGAETGGLSDTVKEGVNGYLLPLEARGDNYAAVIKEIFSDTARYNALVLSSRNYFEKYLNWDAWTNTLAEKLNVYHTSSGNKI